MASGAGRGDGGARTPVLFTPADVALARQRMQTEDWARAEADFVVELCRPWVERTDDELWSLVPGQGIPRATHANPRLGCPTCGREIYRHGLFPWKMSVDRPWKIECPACGGAYPTNDFAAYRRSGPGEKGLFDPRRADPSLLYNAAHPDPLDPRHTWGVDDGRGWVDAEGERWWFVGCYAHWCLWTQLPSAAHALGLAYLYSGERRYAHKGAVLLDRIADAYPEMDLDEYSALGAQNSHGGTGRGRIMGCIWETRLAEQLAQACDMVWTGVQGDQALVRFLSEKASRWGMENPKSSLGEIRRNIEDNLLREFILGCRDRRISGNEGMTQAAMATAAAVLDDPDDTPRALDWLFEPGDGRTGGGHIPATLVGKVDRDGVGSEASPGYCFLWLTSFRRCARVLERCRRYRDYDLHRDYPRLGRMYAAPYRLTVLDTYTLHVADMGQTGDPGMASVHLTLALEGFRRAGSEEPARLAWELNGRQAQTLRLSPLDGIGEHERLMRGYFMYLGLHGPLFDADLEELLQRIGRICGDTRRLTLGSENLNGYGAAIFRMGGGAEGTDGEADGGWAAYLYYGRNGGHGHLDRLSIGLYWRGMDVSPDLGNPEYKTHWWAKRFGWTRNTVSHNTVVVGPWGQRTSYSGHCELYADFGSVGVVEVSSPEVYPELADYRRTLFAVHGEGAAYLVDVFRVVGGDDHLLSFHGAEGRLKVHGIDLEEQPRGTYAGEDVEYGRHYDGEADCRCAGSGFSYLHDVARSAGPRAGWYAEWELEDTWGTRTGSEQVRLRYHVLSSCDEAATAAGDPPVKPGNPEHLGYLLLRRFPRGGAGGGLSGSAGEGTRGGATVYCAVIEPYAGRSPGVAEARRLDLGIDAHDPAAVAVQVILRRGREELVFSSASPDREYRLDRDAAVAGRAAVVSREGGRTVRIRAVGAARVEVPEGTLVTEAPRYRGTIVDFHRSETGRAWIGVRGELATGTMLAGAQLRVYNDGKRDACYTIRGVERRASGEVTVDLGETSFVRGLESLEDYSAGYTYDIEKGQEVEVLSAVDLRICAGGPVETSASTRWAWTARR